MSLVRQGKAVPQVHDTRVLPYQKERDAYEMTGRCGNCGWAGKLLIAQGDHAPSYGLGRHPTTCPSCRCQQVVGVIPDGG